MDPKEFPKQLTALLQKYRYVLLVLLAGVLLMLLPQDTSEQTVPTEVTIEAEPDFASELSDILSLIDGAGRVEVLLSQSAGEQIHYQIDEDRSDSDLRQETVILTDADRAESGLVQRIDPPIYQGAVILCQGADSPSVRLQITQAVANATGLTTDRISVLKMK